MENPDKTCGNILAKEQQKPIGITPFYPQSAIIARTDCCWLPRHVLVVVFLQAWRATSGKNGGQDAGNQLVNGLLRRIGENSVVMTDLCKSVYNETETRIAHVVKK